jgi:cytochrome P450
VLSEGELTGTLATVLVAGHATVTGLLTNGVRALLTDRAQLALLTSGEWPWRAVVDEVVRFDSPIGHFPMRYADLLRLVQEIVGPDVQIVPQAQSAEPPSAHYSITPYSFRPRIARKLVSSYYVDMGQGLLDVLAEIHDEEDGTAS